MSSEAIRNLRSTARDLSSTTFARIPRGMKRTCFILVNTNRAYRTGRGTAPIERAIKLAEVLKEFGYEIYYMANPHCVMFKEYFTLFLERTVGHLFLACFGQGGEPNTQSLIFDDMPMEDDEFIQLINQNRNSSLQLLTMLHDYTIPASVFEHNDVFDKGTVLISCSGDPEMFTDGAGKFIDHLTREVSNRKQITYQQLFDSLRIVMKRNSLTLSVKSSDPADLAQPFAVYEPRVEYNDLIH